MPKMMAIRMHEFGDADVLRLDQIERPSPGENEVLVRVAAASVNPVDWKIRKGGYPAVKQGDLPIVPGRDLAGTVEALGRNATGFASGDRVIAFLDMKHGGYEEYVAVPAALLTKMPSSISFEEAAAIPLAAMTAWQGLFDHGRLRSGERVLIHGGGGGVGHFAIQFAKAKGAWVATTVSGLDIDLARRLGADQVIDYKSERFEDALDPVDMVFDLVGGETQKRSFGVIKNGGILVSTLGEPERPDTVSGNIRVAGYMAKPNADQLHEIADLIEQGQVKVLLHKVFPLDKAADAQRTLENEHVQGKIVLSVD